MEEVEPEERLLVPIWVAGLVLLVEGCWFGALVSAGVGWTKRLTEPLACKEDLQEDFHSFHFFSTHLTLCQGVACRWGQALSGHFVAKENAVNIGRPAHAVLL